MELEILEENKLFKAIPKSVMVENYVHLQVLLRR